MSDLPITFKVTQHDRNVIGEWLAYNNMFDRVTYDWVTREISFGDPEDANAFYLRFGIQRYETQVEKMLKNEESNN